MASHHSDSRAASASNLTNGAATKYEHPNMKTLLVLFCSLSAFSALADVTLDALKQELEALKKRVTALEEDNSKLRKQIDVERLIVRKELIVSDSGEPWEKGFEAQQIARGIYAKSVTDRSVGGLWVRSRLIKGEIDDPFDDRFHALEKDGSRRGSPGHISWNAWVDGAWRQMAIIQGEALEPNEMPFAQWSGGNHPGRLRFQTFRPHHNEPLTDAVIGQGMMSLGGGGYGGGGLPYPKEVLQVWGGEITQIPLATPAAPTVASADDSGEHQYAIIAVSAQGRRTAASRPTKANGLARLRWDSVSGADAYIVVRDGKEVAGPLRLEGSLKDWRDKGVR